MNKLNFDSFAEYVLNTSSDTPIDNTGWHTCAVGSYLLSRGIHVSSARGNIIACTTKYRVPVTAFMLELSDIDGLESSGTVDTCSLEDKLNWGDYDSYGELQDDLKEILS